MIRFTCFTQTKLLNSLGMSFLGKCFIGIHLGLSGINKLYLVHICALIWIHFSNVAEMYSFLSLKMTL